MTQLAGDGAGRVVFFFAPGLKAGATRYDAKTKQYVIEINLASAANPHKVAAHESIHMWLGALDRQTRITVVDLLAHSIFGKNYEEAYKVVAKTYANDYKGRSSLEALINEEMVAYAYGGWGELVGTNFSFKKYRSARRRGKPEEAGHGAKLREEAD